MFANQIELTSKIPPEIILTCKHTAAIIQPRQQSLGEPGELQVAEEVLPEKEVAKTQRRQTVLHHYLCVAIASDAVDRQPREAKIVPILAHRESLYRLIAKATKVERTDKFTLTYVVISNRTLKVQYIVGYEPLRESTNLTLNASE